MSPTPMKMPTVMTPLTLVAIRPGSNATMAMKP